MSAFGGITIRPNEDKIRPIEIAGFVRVDVQDFQRQTLCLRRQRAASPRGIGSISGPSSGAPDWSLSRIPCLLSRSSIPSNKQIVWSSLDRADSVAICARRESYSDTEDYFTNAVRMFLADGGMPESAHRLIDETATKPARAKPSREEVEGAPPPPATSEEIARAMETAAKPARAKPREEVEGAPPSPA